MQVPNQPNNLIPLREAKLARLLDEAAAFHRQGDLGQGLRAIRAAEKISSEDLEELNSFLAAWAQALESEKRGLPLPAAPASWPKVAGEIKRCLETQSDFRSCIQGLMEQKRPASFWARRAALIFFGAASFAAGFTILAFVLRGAISGFDPAYRVAHLPFFRQGVWMYVHAAATFIWGTGMAFVGFRWIRQALEARTDLSPRFHMSAVDLSDQNRGQ